MKAVVLVNKDQIEEYAAKQECVLLTMTQEEAIEIGASYTVVNGSDTYFYKNKPITLEINATTPQNAKPMTEEQIHNRLDVCNACEHSSNPEDAIMNTCNLCGCSIDMLTRTNYKFCPKGKWGAV